LVIRVESEPEHFVREVELQVEVEVEASPFEEVA
jgi:hypothetical protein